MTRALRNPAPLEERANAPFNVFTGWKADKKNAGYKPESSPTIRVRNTKPMGSQALWR